MITAVVTSIAITQREARLEKERRQAEAEAAAKKSVVVVGAGVCGLAAAAIFRNHGFTPVTVLEAVGEPLDSPGMLTLAPNALRVLERVDGLKAEIFEAASDAKGVRYRSHQTGKIRHTAPLCPENSAELPTLVLTWCELHQALQGFAEELGAKIQFGDPVTEYHDTPEDLDGPLPHGRPYALTTSGKKYYADVIVCADGFDSAARRHVATSLGLEAETPMPTGFSYFRGSVSSDALKKDTCTKTATLLDEKHADIWVGPKAYLAVYPFGEGAEWMYHLVRSDTVLPGESNGYECKSKIKSLKKCVEKWEPSLVETLQKSTELYDQRLTTLANKYPPGVSKNSKKLVLIGDAAHSFPPATSQSLSMSIEDIAVLSVCMKKAASIPLALEVYSRLRKPRVEYALAAAEERTEVWRERAAKGMDWKVKHLEFDEQGLWEFDAEKDAEANFDGIIEQLTVELLAKRQAMLKAAAEAQAAAQANSAGG